MDLYKLKMVVTVTVENRGADSDGCSNGNYESWQRKLKGQMGPATIRPMDGWDETLTKNQERQLGSLEDLAASHPNTSSTFEILMQKGIIVS